MAGSACSSCIRRSASEGSPSTPMTSSEQTVGSMPRSALRSFCTLSFEPSKTLRRRTSRLRSIRPQHQTSEGGTRGQHTLVRCRA
jgi:hypothetical protein